MKLARSLGSVSAALLLTFAGVARADLPPPPGQTRVDYTFRVSGKTADVSLVAFPMYGKNDRHFAAIELDKDLRPVQGYTPGIYSLDAATLASLDGKDDDAIKAVLASKARVCVKEVPRVFTVADSTNVSAMTDVFTVEATASACKASFAKTLYASAKGDKAEGSVDAKGHRVAPKPFGGDLPAVGDLGFPLGTAATPSPSTSSVGAPTTPTAPTSTASTTGPSTDGTAPQRGGCAGCATAGGTTTTEAALAVAVTLGALARRRSARRSRAARP
jgi:hypothetical protein